MVQNATYFTNLGYAALITVGGMTLAGLLYKLLNWLNERRKDVTEGWEDGAPPEAGDDGLKRRDPVSGAKWASDEDWDSEALWGPSDEPYPHVGTAPNGEPMEDAPTDVVAPSPERERRTAQYMAEQAAHRELAEGVLSVRCPVCRSPEAVTCNPELPEDMPVVHLDSCKFAHGLRIVKAAGLGKVTREVVLENLPDDDLGAQVREGLAEGPSGSA